jgi:hypothetical protein
MAVFALCPGFWNELVKKGNTMTFLRILFWGFVCCGIGMLLNWAFAPSNDMQCAGLFAIPFVLLGFQEDSLLRKSSRSVIGMPLYVNHLNSKRLTFWGIPIGGMRDHRRNVGAAIREVPFGSDYRPRHCVPVVLSKIKHDR